MKKTTALLCALALLVPVFAATAPTKGDEPLRIAHGEKVKLADYLVPGKITVFDFTSVFCPPCRAYEQPLHNLHTKRADVVVIKVDVNRPKTKRIDWDSPVARQFAIYSIPQFKVFGPDGKLVAEDKIVVDANGNVTTNETPATRMVDAWIAQLGN